MPRGQGKRRTSTWDRRMQKADDKEIKKRSRIDELFSLRHIPPTKQCPVTCGRPTQMTAAQFERMCQHNQDLVGAKVGPFTAPASRVSWCAVCQGNLRPKELRLVSERTLRDRREREMKAKEKARTGETVRAYGESSRRGGNL